MWPINSGARFARIYIKECWEFSQYSNLALLLPSWMCWSQSLSENFRAPLSPNTLSNVGFIVFRWLLRQLLALLDHNGAQSHDQFRDSGWKRFPFKWWTSKNTLPLPFLHRYHSFRVAHWTRRSPEWSRTPTLHNKVHLLLQLLVPKHLGKAIRSQIDSFDSFLGISQLTMFVLDYSEIELGSHEVARRELG